VVRWVRVMWWIGRRKAIRVGLHRLGWLTHILAGRRIWIGRMLRILRCGQHVHGLLSVLEVSLTG
jgi:hypothetical protein